MRPLAHGRGYCHGQLGTSISTICSDWRIGSEAGWSVSTCSVLKCLARLRVSGVTASQRAHPHKLQHIDKQPMLQCEMAPVIACCIGTLDRIWRSACNAAKVFNKAGRIRFEAKHASFGVRALKCWSEACLYPCDLSLSDALDSPSDLCVYKWCHC